MLYITQIPMWTFKPILKPTIWGGDRIAKFKKIHTPFKNIGESWEISGVEGSESVVAEGPDKGVTLSALIDRYGPELVGQKNYAKYGDRFPLLVKFIDASQNLSVQVHPGDEMAQRHGMPNGKNEMWYVLHADRGATLVDGFTHPLSRSQYEKYVKAGNIEQALNYIPISEGDVFYIPAGRVHAIGKGAFVAEIQQTSDATYRIYDYHRVGDDGRERKLHIEEAKEAVDFDGNRGGAVEYLPVMNLPVNIVKSSYFTTNVLNADRELMRDYSEKDSFVVIIATSGKATLTTGDESMEIEAGMSVLIPAKAKSLVITPHGVFSALETYIN